MGMVPAAAIVIAYRDLGVAERARSYKHVTGAFAHLGLPIIHSDGEPGEFSRARAINDGVRAAARSGVRSILQVDPDSFVPLLNAVSALQNAERRPGLVIAHDRYVYASAVSSAAYLAKPYYSRYSSELEIEPDEVGTGGVGNVVAFSVETWRSAGGFDERFATWGGDDAVFAYAAEANTGEPMRRIAGPVYHLWHPRLPQSVPGHPGYVKQFRLVAEFRDAAAMSPQAVRALRRDFTRESLTNE